MRVPGHSPKTFELRPFSLIGMLDKTVGLIFSGRHPAVRMCGGMRGEFVRCIVLLRNHIAGVW